MNIRRTAVLLCMGLICNANIASAQEPTADAKFQQIYTDEWSWRQHAASTGSEEEGGGGGRPRAQRSNLPKVDAATQLSKQHHWEDTLAHLDTIRPADLSPANQMNYSVYRPQIITLINQQRFKDYEKPLNSDNGFWNQVNGAASRPMHSVQDYENYISMLRDVPRFFGEEMINMRAGLARGFTPPQVTLQGRERPIELICETNSIPDNPLYKPFRNMPKSIAAADQQRLQAEGQAAIHDAALPAYRELLRFMRDDYIPHARKELGADKMPDGKAYYQAKILEFTTTTLTPEQIHQIGVDEVAKIHAEMLDVMKQVNFKGDLPAFLKFLRTDPQFYPKTPAEFLERAAWISKEFDGKSSQYFGYLPRQRFGIVPTPADRAPFATGGNGGPGTYLLNTYDLPSRPFYSLTALTLHEAAPGHAFQMPIINEHKELPPFRRVYISAYGEGWALYCERLGVEMGSYHTPYETFGMLSYQSWRAARLVVDTGIHSMGWTRERAMQYLRDNTALSEHEIQTETDRYIAYPAQALSYYLGEMAIWRARHKAEAALGQKFNIRAFHDTVLEMGSVPLPVLEARIDRFIAEGGRGPYPDLE
jgi:uncharacterized protein (DUF885 family)